MAESFHEQLSRLRSMACGDPTWDLSDNDIAAVTAFLKNRDDLLVALREVRDAAAAAMRVIHRHGIGEEFIAEARAASVSNGFGVRADDLLKMRGEAKA